MTEDSKQLNVHLPAGFVDKADEFRQLHGWSRLNLVATAITVLAQVMEAHERFASHYDDDQADLYMRLAREMPAGFVKVPKDGIKVGRAGELPAILVDSWLIFPDRETGNLVAENQRAEGPRVGVVKDGEIRPLKLPSAAEVALN
jgi:hypothetical protein